MGHQELASNSDEQALSRTIKPPEDRTECLRVILESKQGRSITYDEAEEVGESLISFFEVLGEASQDETTPEISALENLATGAV